MTARKLKVERLGPKEWEFECAPEEYCLTSKFDSAVDLMEAGKDEEAEKILPDSADDHGVVYTIVLCSKKKSCKLRISAQPLQRLS